MSKSDKIHGGILAVLVLTAWGLLGEDVIPLLSWWLALLALGLGFWPAASRLFKGFSDKGWLFSKVLGIAVTGYLMWLLNTVKLVKFRNGACVAVAIICIGVNFLVMKKKGWEIRADRRLVLTEECIFLALFLLWTYLAGFRPGAHGTEKFMDYGFMATMMRSDYMPAQDMWYAGEGLNYYYGGQYYACFLTRLTFTRIQETYNLMRTMVAAFAFALPFSLVRQMLADRWQRIRQAGSGSLAALGGVLAGAAVSLAGNMHYVLYGKLFPMIRELLQLPYEGTAYWFPNSTRYIGYNPEVANDKTIHEFPSYSFVLGDLHAHVVNLMFVLLVVGILYAWLQQRRRQGDRPISLVRGLRQPWIWLLGFFIGVFQWTNFWDFAIYYVVGGAVLVLTLIRSRGKRPGQVAAHTVFYAVVILLFSWLVVLPFTLQFETMFSGIGIAQRHSRLYQLVILWGLPAAVGVLLLIWAVTEHRRNSQTPGRFLSFFRERPLPELFAVILTLCAMGLVLLPELVYVRDIYEENYARSNTMFKLTYQAFTLFGIVMGYTLICLLAQKGRRALRALAGICLALLLCTLGYFGTSVHAWFGNVWDPAGYQGLDATAFLETDFPEDAGAVRWLMENAQGQPVVLEAHGDSYSDCERVSAMTGLPTVAGWYVHQWLWRNDLGALNQRVEDVRAIYTSTDPDQVRELLKEYQVEYIFVGSQERAQYPEINEELLLQLGTVVYQGSQGQAYILQVGN